MKIQNVDAFLMSYPMEKPIRLPFYGGVRTVIKRDAMLIRVTGDNGIKGFAPGPAHERALREIQGTIAPFLVGREASDWASFQFPGDLEITKTYHAVELAVLDLVARSQQLPLSEVLGSRVRDQIKVYGSAGMYMEPEGFAEEAVAIRNLGFPAYKMRPALGPEKDLETVRLMREATGDDFGLMIDAHSWWRMGDRSFSKEQVLETARAMGAHRPVWLEEPLPPEDHEDYRELKDRGYLPVASGEHEQTEPGFMDLIERRAVDYLQMDLFCQGGVGLARRLFAGLQKANMRFAFHSWGTHLEVLAAAHLGICWPESVVEWLECPCYSNNGKPGMYPFPTAEDLLAEPLDIRDGYLQVPKGPGLGIEIDESVVARYPFIPGPWSYFQLDSPPSTVAVTGDHSVKWVDTEKQ